jgi:hypothetical protein
MNRPTGYHLWPREKQDAWFNEHYGSNSLKTPTFGPIDEQTFGKGEKKGAFGSFGSDQGIRFSWPAPKPIPEDLAPVDAFDLDFLPSSVGPWVADIAERMQCPVDFVAIPAIVALGATLGRKIGIRPKRKNDWTEVPNLWGCIVGRPGAMKSPAMGEALKPLNRLDARAREEHSNALKSHQCALEMHKLRVEEARAAAKTALKKGTEPRSFDVVEPEEPKARRYVINDTTCEALGEILADNPNGVLAFRDELVSLLKSLDREEYVTARGFFLTAWNGTSSYTFDRIMRGKTHIDAVCLSLLGSTQPGRLAEYIKRASDGGASVSASSFGQTKVQNGETLTTTLTVRRERMRGMLSSS